MPFQLQKRTAMNYTLLCGIFRFFAVIGMVIGLFSISLSAQVTSPGKIIYPEEYPVFLYSPAGSLPEKREFLRNVIISLIEDQLNIQRSAKVAIERPVQIEYPYPALQGSASVLEDPLKQFLVKFPAGDSMRPVKIIRSTEVEPELVPSAFHLLTKIKAQQAGKIKLDLQLYFERDILFEEVIEFEEQEMVNALFDITALLRKELNGGTGSHLEVTAVPERVSVYLDKMFLGKTPLKAKWLPEGRHELEFKAEGYPSKTVPVNLTHNTWQKVSATLETSDNAGELDIDSYPTGAKVYLGVEYKGLTPLKIPHLPAGKHRLRISRLGFIDKYVPVELKAGEIFRVRSVLDEGDNAEFYNPRPEVFLGLTYNNLFQGSLYAGLGFLGGGIFALVQKDREREEMLASLSTVSPSLYTSLDRQKIADSTSRQDDYQNLANLMGIGAAVSFSAALYFFIKDAFTQDIGYALKKIPQESESQIGSVEFRTFTLHDKTGLSFSYTF
ncbi:MAG: PEGA domain-containing protein [Leptospiraceae bacterium]|nr:PEGA domain-containing protein [Leptospiraceae bacterium]